MPKENPRPGSVTPARTVKVRINKQAVVPPKSITPAERSARQITLAAQAEPSKVNNMMLVMECPEHPARREPLKLVMKDNPEPVKWTYEETGETLYETFPFFSEVQLRRRVYSTMRQVHAFRKLNPADAEQVADGRKPFCWRVYAETNEQARYISIIVGDGCPGELCIVGPNVFWEPLPDERFARYGVKMPFRVELKFHVLTQIELRFVKDRIVMLIRIGQEYVSNGEQGVDYEDHCFILWSSDTAITAIQMISWLHKKAVEASGNTAAKTLAYADDGKTVSSKQIEREFDYEYDSGDETMVYYRYDRFEEPMRKMGMKTKLRFNPSQHTNKWIGPSPVDEEAEAAERAGGLRLHAEDEHDGLGEEENAGPECFRASNPWKGGQTPRAFKKFERYFL